MRPSLSKFLARAVTAGILAGAVCATAADAATIAEINGWLATTTSVVRTSPPPGVRRIATRSTCASSGANVEGSIDPAEALKGYLKNNQEVMIAPIESGGSGAVFDALLFTRVAGRTQFVGIIPSPNGHLDVALAGGVIVVPHPDL